MPTPANLDANAILSGATAKAEGTAVYGVAGAIQQARETVAMLGGPVGATFVLAVAGLLTYRTVTSK